MHFQVSQVYRYKNKQGIVDYVISTVSYYGSGKYNNIGTNN